MLKVKVSRSAGLSGQKTLQLQHVFLVSNRVDFIDFIAFIMGEIKDVDGSLMRD
jgi:hypothetical protein